MRHLLLPAMLFALLTAGGCGSDPGAPAGDPGPREEDPDPTVAVGTDPGDLAPDFTLAAAGGGDVILSESRGRPVLLYFWASWCSYCTQQTPRVEEFHRLGGEGLAVYGINLNDTALVVDAYVAEHGLTFPVLFGTNGVISEYGIRSIPRAIVLDADGIVVFNDHPAALTEGFLAGI